MQLIEAVVPAPASPSDALDRHDQRAADLNATLLALDPQQLVIAGVELEDENDSDDADSDDVAGGGGVEQAFHSSHAIKVAPDTRRYSDASDGSSDDEDSASVLGCAIDRETSTPVRPMPPLEQAREEGKEAAGADRSSLPNADFAIWNIVQLLRPSSAAMDKQIYMSVGALVLSLVLGSCALVFRDEILDATQINAGLVLGSAGTLVMCSSIIGTYLTTKWYRRHMHILLVNLAAFDLLLALSFVLEPAWKSVGASVGEGHTCRWVRPGAGVWRLIGIWGSNQLAFEQLSIVREYLIMCSTVWTMCMALDLYYLMTDPFTSPRMNRRKYQVIVHSSAGLGAVIMGASSAFDAPVAVGNFCWVGAQQEDANTAQAVGRSGIWIFIIAPVTLSMAANIFVTFVSYSRFRDGISATLKSRQVLLREGFLTTVTVIVYSALLWGSYGGYWVAATPQQTQLLSTLFAFLLSYRGSVAFILWCLYKRPAAAAVRSKLRKLRRQAAATTTTAHARRSSLNTESSDDEDDDAVRPQMNIALLQELVACTTEGIARAVRSASAPIGGDGGGSCTFTLRPPSHAAAASGRGCEFTDFRPLAFLRVRQFFNIDEDAYLASLADCTTPKVSEGASGAFMFYSRDRSYIVKSLSGAESSFLHSFLDAYVDHLTAHRRTFLTRFLGSYCIVLYGKKAHFVVMENVFDIQHGVSIHQRYDVKGSWVDRNAQKAKRGSEATCRHCNLSFRCGVGRNVCPNRAGSHEPNVVLKDMDLTTKLRFGRLEGKKLVHQLKRDSDFLCDQGIMDYSLLLGVIEVSYQVNQQNILTRDGSVFLENLGAAARARDVDAAAAADSSGGQAARPHERLKQSSQCLRTSEVVIGPGFYYIGLIDILQTWNMAKRVERFIKTVILRKDPEGISAMAPKPYRDRFHRKLDEIIHLGHNSVVVPSPRSRGGSAPSRLPSHGVPSFRDSDVESGVAVGDLTSSMRMMQGRPTHALLGVPSFLKLGDAASDLDGDGDEAPAFVNGQVRRGSVFHGALPPSKQPQLRQASQ
ncbi:hypothetical protein PybrP1_000328 [[Pythium] brassicae (nom. inval.)]|nr:hypothetical protein PybrP1_000328 [[Pythium] brassicae (nom. inval.)]